MLRPHSRPVLFPLMLPASTPSERPPSSSEPVGQLTRTRDRLLAGVERGQHVGGQVFVSRGAGAQPRARQAQEASPQIERWSFAIGERLPGVPMSTADSMLWMSATKPVTAVLLGLLWQEGAFDLDDPVARFIPEFAARGKDAITVRHLLTHTAGIRLIDLGWPERSWDEIVAYVAAHRPEPRWVPGDRAGYHLASSWFVLGEIARRLDGRPFAELVRERVLEPAGMLDSWIGIPEAEFDAATLAPVWDTSGAEPVQRGHHCRIEATQSQPGGNGWGPVRDLGRFYEMLLRRGVTEAGERLLSPQTVEAMTVPQRVGLHDRTFQQALDWGLGFIIDSKHYGAPSVTYGYGPHASRRTFGHSGFQSSVAFADPMHDLVIALAVNGQPGEDAHRERFDQLCGAIYEDLGLAENPDVAVGR
ncbi:MAG: serine hydrolase domain-containing protein [Acidobacteriota bacterium]